ncbi:MAG: hypothetical protein SynsKO_18380 [Synoicihabitans sp.]
MFHVMKNRLLFLGLIFSTCSLLLTASDDAGATPAASQKSAKIAGPFEVLEIDMDFLQDVSYRNDRIYLKRQLNRLNDAITLRASMLKGEAYRKWFNGEYDLVSPANAGHRPNGWTDWVETTANYVEYWVDGKKVLHLRRIGS